jgi:hypothetical protein
VCVVDGDVAVERLHDFFHVVVEPSAGRGGADAGEDAHGQRAGEDRSARSTSTAGVFSCRLDGLRRVLRTGRRPAA